VARGERERSVERVLFRHAPSRPSSSELPEAVLHFSLGIDGKLAVAGDLGG
jgi:hypothetical protein